MWGGRVGGCEFGGKGKSVSSLFVPRMFQPYFSTFVFTCFFTRCHLEPRIEPRKGCERFAPAAPACLGTVRGCNKLQPELASVSRAS